MVQPPPGRDGRPGSDKGAAISVLVVDDDPLLCSGMAFTLGKASGGTIDVIGSAANGREAIAAAAALDPDVILMDIAMPVLDGLSATREIRQAAHAPEIIIITTFDADDEPVRAAAAGAAGFLLKSEDPADIIAAIHAVARGEGALSRRTAKQLLTHVATMHERGIASEDAAAANAADGAYHGHERAAVRAASGLTKREYEIAILVTEGLSNPQIAAELHLSESTVKTHLSAIMDKLGTPNRVSLAVEMTYARIAHGA